MPRAVLLAGLSFGDEGKGTICDALVRQLGAHTVVRYNGGAQAAHNVCIEGGPLAGAHHTFAQFGSGTFVPGVETHLGRHMRVNPLALAKEGKTLQSLGVEDVFSRLTIAEEALLTSPFHVALNRLRELLRDKSRHGSCGMGIGETVADSLARPDEVVRAGDLANPVRLREKLTRTREVLHQAAMPLVEGVSPTRAMAREILMLADEGAVDACLDSWMGVARLIRIVDSDYLAHRMREGTTVFEGAQGVLLDQAYGFFPYVTRSDTTFWQAIYDLAGFRGDVRRIGIVRTYATRHGAGPFVTEDPNLNHPEAHNGDGLWQQGFRLGHFDLAATKYAVDVLGRIDGLAVTHMDRAGSFLQVATGYQALDGSPYYLRRPDRPTLEGQAKVAAALRNVRPVYTHVKQADFLDTLRAHLGCTISALSHGPTELRKWVNLGDF